MRNKYFQAWGKIDAICLQNNIAEIYFIINRSNLHFSFFSMSGDASDIYRFPKRKETKIAKITWSLFTSYWEICEYQRHPQICNVEAWYLTLRIFFNSHWGLSYQWEMWMVPHWRHLGSVQEIWGPGERQVWPQWPLWRSFSMIFLWENSFWTTVRQWNLVLLAPVFCKFTKSPDLRPFQFSHW